MSHTPNSESNSSPSSPSPKSPSLKSPSPKSGRVKLAGLLVAGALIAAACGSSGPAETSTAVDPPAAAASVGEEAMEEAMEDDEAMEVAMEEDAMDDDYDDSMEDGAMEDEDAMEDGAMEDEDASDYGDDDYGDDAADDDYGDDDYGNEYGSAAGEQVTLGATGPGCLAVPADGEGSFAGMADDPAGTAASNNPLLSTLVAAVSQAGLVDTLNSEGPFTIFAPTNDAFAAIDPADLEAVLADQELLTTILTNHVVAGQSLSASELAEAGTVTTVGGGELTFELDGQLAVGSATSATAVCQDVPTANATVHIIDQVLLPLP